MSGTRVATIGNNLLLFVQTVWEVMKICYGGHFSTLLSCFIVYWRHQLYLLIPIYRAVQTLALAILLSLPWPTGQPKNHQVATSTNVYLNFGHFTHTFKTINHVGRPTYIVYVIPLGAAYFILFIGPTADGLIILLQNRHWTLDTSWRRTADLLLKVGKIVLILFSCLPHCTDNKNVTTPFDDLIASRPWQMMEQQQCISNNNNSSSSSTDCHWDGIILVVASSASSGGGHQQCGGAVVAAVVLLLSPAATRHTAPDTWARASPRTASRDGHRQHWIARYLHRITRCLQCLGVTIMLIKLEHTKVLAKWTWTCWGISRSRSAR